MTAYLLFRLRLLDKIGICTRTGDEPDSKHRKQLAAEEEQANVSRRTF